MNIETKHSNKLLDGECILPKEVRIYYEDGNPFLDYYGYAQVNGKNAIIHFPKIDLKFTTIENETIRDRDYSNYTTRVTMRQNVYVYDNKYYEVEILPVAMTKSEIEQVLGYPVNIVEDK
jgi:hypothetical protein